MSVEKENQSIEHIQNLRSYLPEKTQEELDEILAYGEKMKAEGERKKQEFWSTHSKNQFKILLKYKRKHDKKIEKNYKYLDKMNEFEKKKFIDEYLYDDMLYSGKVKESFLEKFFRKNPNIYGYYDWKKGHIRMKNYVVLAFHQSEFGVEDTKEIVDKLKLKYGMSLLLKNNKLGDEGAKIISKMELEDCVEIRLDDNQIGAEGAKAIAENMELKEGVVLGLAYNEIGDEGAEALSKMELKDGVWLYLERNCIGDAGAKAIAQNLKLKEGVYLDLRFNQIGDEGAETIMNNLELKNSVTLKLVSNNISDEMKTRLRNWQQSNRERGIFCWVDL